MVMRDLGAIVLFVACLAFTAGASSADIADCDRSGDNQVTVVDALITLQSAVNNCVADIICDADGDLSETVSDALALLRYAVGLPVELDCACIFLDECFEDSDCSQRTACVKRCATWIPSPDWVATSSASSFPAATMKNQFHTCASASLPPSPNQS